MSARAALAARTQGPPAGWPDQGSGSWLGPVRTASGGMRRHKVQAIIIAAVSGGALTALVNTIGSYLARDRRTEVEIQTHDGRKVRISSQMFKQKEMEELLRQSLAMTGD